MDLSDASHTDKHGLSKKELEDEIIAIQVSIDAHESQMKLHKYAIRVDKFLKYLMEKQLPSFK